MNKGRTLRISQFGRLALYFPLYLALRKGFFKSYGFSKVYFKNTYNDAETYMSLIKNEADVGLSDPIFAISEENTPKGEVIGTLVTKVPFIAISKKKVNIFSFENLLGYRIGTYSSYTTNHTLTEYLLKKKTKPLIFDYHQLIPALLKNKIDIAMVLPEQLNKQQELNIVYDFRNLFSRFLFTGFTISPFLNDLNMVASFRLAVNDSLKFIKGNKKLSLAIFKKEFPKLIDHEEIFNKYVDFWPSELTVKQEEFINALNTWGNIYPTLFKEQTPAFLFSKKEQAVTTILCAKKYSRDYPYLLEKMINLIKVYLNNNLKIPLVGFWGASNKRQLNKYDYQLINRLSVLNKEVQKYCLGLNITMILCDQHAIINGFDKKIIREYLNQVKSELLKNDIKFVWLSDIWKRHGLTEKTILTKAKDLQFNKFKLDKELLIKQAHSHYRTSDELLGAKVYCAMRSVEAPLLKKDFPNHIFFSYSSANIKNLLPQAPTLFFYSLGRDINELPWFLK